MNGHEFFFCPQALSKIKIGLLDIFFADSQKFILSCVMQATWNKSLNANIVHCVQYLEKRGQSFKICFNNMMS